MGSSSSAPVSNAENTVESISDDNFSKWGVRLSFCDEFIDHCGGLSTFEGLSVTEVCQRIVKPMTEPSKLSYCELLRSQNHPGVGVAEVFISQAWKYSFLDLMSALKCHFREKPDVIIWLDLFSNSQHVYSLKPFNWWVTTFKTKIAELGRVVMILSPWNDPIPLKRAWCVFELYCAVDGNADFEIAMCEREQELFLNSMIVDANGEINKMLSLINCETSEAFNPQDRDNIYAAIRGSVGFNRLNSVVFEKLRDWMIATTNDFLIRETDPIKKLKIQSALATILRNQGNLDKAESLYVSCLEQRRTQLGDRHPDTLMSMNLLATVYDIQGKYSKAEPLYVSCFEMRKRSLGPDHHDTLASMNNLAFLYENQDKCDDAESLYTTCFQKRSALLGSDHPDTLLVMHNLAALYDSLSMYDNAVSMYSTCLEKRRTVLGSDHPDTLMSMNNLAFAYDNQGKYDKAEPLYASCLEKRSVRLGSDHPDTLMTMHNLAVLYETRGFHDKAKALRASFDMA